MYDQIIHTAFLAIALFGRLHSMDWNDERAVRITFANGMEWVEGFVNGFAAENNLVDTEKCAMDAEHLTPDVEKLIKDFTAHKVIAVGIDMSKIAVEVPKDVKDCLAVKGSTDGPRLEAFFM